MSEPTLCICGIDPGLSGAIAFYFPAAPEVVSAEDAPLVSSEIDAATLATRFEQMRPNIAVVERVSAMPKQGVASTFRPSISARPMASRLASSGR